MADDKKDEADARVRRIIVRVACGAGLAMAVWAGLVLLWALWPEPNNFTVPGTFGDAFAPIVGLMNSLVLGAAIASVLMQREELQSQRDLMELQRQEMQLAREQYTAQAAALADANKHAIRANDLQARSNELARHAQLLEVSRQVEDIDELARSVLATYKATRGLSTLIHDPLETWLDYASANPEECRTRFQAVNTSQLQALAKRREDLEATRIALRGGLISVKPEPPSTYPREPV